MNLRRKISLVYSCALILSGAFLVNSAYAASAAELSTKLDEVKRGIRTDVVASWWGFDAKDATDCLQAAIDSGAKRVLVDDVGSEWLVRPIYLRSNQEIIFADGVIVRAKPGEFHGLNDNLFNAIDVENIVMRGEGKVRLVMNKSDYLNSDLYRPSEWRNLISIRGVDGFSIQNITLDGSGGDGIYIGRGKLPGSRRVFIDNVVCIGHHRQGISIISVDGMVIRNSTFNDTEGTAPAAGIDFEPNHADEWLANCIVENSVFNGNNGAGILIYLKNLNESSRAVSIVIKDVEVNENRIGAEVYSSVTQLSPSGIIRFENISFSGNRNGGINIFGQQEDRLRLEFKDVAIDNGVSKLPAIRFISNQPYDVGNVLLDVSVLGGPSTVLDFLGGSGGGIKSIEGAVNYQRVGSGVTSIDLAGFIAAHPEDAELKNFKNAGRPDLKALVPAKPSESAIGSDTSWQMRGRSVYMQYSSGENPVAIDFTVKKIGPSGARTRVLVRDPSYTQVDSFEFNGLEHSYMLTATNPGVYYFEINSGKHAVFATSDTSGRGWGATDRMGIINTKGKLYFIVPPRTKEFSIEVAGQINEPVSARLFDPSGRNVGEVNRVQDTQIISSNGGNRERYAVWCLEVSYAREDYNIRLGAPLLPIVATDLDNLLIYEKWVTP